MKKISELLNSGGVWRFGVVLVLFIGLVFAFRELVNVVDKAAFAKSDFALPLLAIGGFIVLILMLTLVAVIFGFFDLQDKTQAMGLPEGSIRAVIAISLIVLFAILAIHLYKGVSKGGPLNTIEHVSIAQRDQVLKDHPTALDVQAVLATDGQGHLLKDTSGGDLYNVRYRSANSISDDFAKQLLVLLGTLMTAIISFYLGAGTAISAAAAKPTDSATPLQPTVTGINPKTISVGKDGPVIRLQVLGNNLNNITHLKIVRAGAQLVGTDVGSISTRVTCDIAVSAATTPPGPPWDVVIDDGASKSVTLPAALLINA